MKVLVVDDESGVRAVLQMVLDLAGHEAHFAADGDEALKLYDSAEPPFNLVITDHMMERISGLELTRNLRARGYKGAIIVLTAYAALLDQREFEKCGVEGVMKKPFDLAELRRWIEACDHTGMAA